MNFFEELSYEIFLEIVSYMDLDTIINYSKVDKHIYNNINLSDFWQRKSFIDYNIEYDIFNKDNNISFLQRYIKISKYNKLLIFTCKKCLYSEKYKLEKRNELIEKIKNITIIEIELKNYIISDSEMKMIKEKYKLKIAEKFESYSGFFPRFVILSDNKELNMLYRFDNHLYKNKNNIEDSNKGLYCVESIINWVDSLNKKN